MKKKKKISNSLKKIEKQLDICKRCGMCQSVCPLYEQTGKESDVARGKLAIIDGLKDEFFENIDNVNSVLNKCLLCGSCTANCPSGVNSTEIFIKARSILNEYSKLDSFGKFLLKFFLKRPGLFNLLFRLTTITQPLLFRNTMNINQTSCLRIQSSDQHKRHFKTFSKKQFTKINRINETEKGKSGLKVLLFTGCIIDKFYPEITASVISVLNYHKVGYVILQNTVCCGMPFLSGGDTDSYETFLKQNLSVFKENKFDYIVTACATCTSTIKKFWPVFFNNRNESEINFTKKISEKTLDIHKFIVSHILKENDALKNYPDGNHKHKIITYHDPCHLKKSLNIFSEPRELIRQNMTYDFVEIKNSDKCCGMGGSFNLDHYELSREIGNQKFDNIKDTGCHVVSTGCPACMMHITDMISNKNEDILVKHSIEIYADHIKEL